VRCSHLSGLRKSFHVTIERIVNASTCRDTAGQERYATLAPMYYRYVLYHTT
jgi:GTPase SAR1 family protein